VGKITEIMASSMHWTSSDLDLLPYQEGEFCEIIDGELYVSKQPHWHHQYVCTLLLFQLQAWSKETRLGRANLAPGVIFSEDNDVAPDVVWISNERLKAALDKAGHLHLAPELIVEVLSPGHANERRDREIKLELYSRRGVEEYWIVDWQARKVEVYRRKDLNFEKSATLSESDTLVSGILPGFVCQIAPLFEGVDTC
jgi:Uma2 family endonuclease